VTNACTHLLLLLLLLLLLHRSSHASVEPSPAAAKP
jgi:hypothetical protein